MPALNLSFDDACTPVPIHRLFAGQTYVGCLSEPPAAQKPRATRTTGLCVGRIRLRRCPTTPLISLPMQRGEVGNAPSSDRLPVGAVVIGGRHERQDSFHLHEHECPECRFPRCVARSALAALVEIEDLGKEFSVAILGPGFITGLFIDSRGTQWVIKNATLYRTGGDGVPFRVAAIHSLAFDHFKEDFDHSLWFPGNHVDSLGRPLPPLIQNLPLADVLRTSDGDLWMAPFKGGLVRIPHGEGPKHGSSRATPVLDEYTQKDGLSSHEVHVLFMDADGSIWAGGSRGLDRFVRASLVPAIGGAVQGAWSTCTNPQGEVWLASPDGRVSVIRNGQRKTVYKTAGILKLLCGRKGDVWLLDDHAVAEVVQDRPHRLPLPPGRALQPEGWNFVAVLELSDHELFASEAGLNSRGLWTYKNGRWEEFPRTIEAGYVTVQSEDIGSRTV